MRENHYYFTHDANAKDDPKCTYLIESLGLEGYGIFWVLVETLRGQPDYKYPIRLIPALARKYNTTTDKIQVVINYYDLFIIEDEMFFSLSLNRRMELYENKRLKQSEGGKLGNEKRWHKNNLLIGNQSVSDNLPIAIKENKNKSKSKIKEEELLCGEPNKLALPPADVIEIFISKDKQEFYFTESDLKELKPVYPNVDIKQQILEMKQWLLSNPERNKTHKGMRKFINGWLNREQDRKERQISFQKPKETVYLEDKPKRYEEPVFNINDYKDSLKKLGVTKWQ